MDAQDNDINFSGKLLASIGLLFSSCGFKATAVKSDFSFEELEPNFASTNFNKQLDLMSYTQVHESNLWKTLSSRYKDMFSMSEIEFLNSVRLDNNILKWDIDSSRDIVNSCAAEQNNFTNDNFSSNLACSKKFSDSESLSSKSTSEKSK